MDTICPTESLRKLITLYEPKFKGNYGPITEIHNLVYNPNKDKLDVWITKFEKFHRDLMILNNDWSDLRKETLFDAHMFKAFSNCIKIGCSSFANNIVVIMTLLSSKSQVQSRVVD